jgi:hypothetical protein
LTHSDFYARQTRRAPPLAIQEARVMGTRIARLNVLSITGIAVLFGLALTCSQAAAQGTPEQRAACEGDAMRLCGQYNDVNQISACMKRMRAHVSARCRAAMARQR